MRLAILALIIALVPFTSGAGPISRQFGSGYGGVPWGSSLPELVAAHPGGTHFFAYGGGQREYNLPDEKPMFGISRSGMQVYYFLDETGSVVSASLTFPYEYRQKLLGSLILSFGPYQQMQTKGISTYYLWQRDDGTGVTAEATLDPDYGILRLVISGPNSALLKNIASNCKDQPASPQKGKK